MRVRPVPLVPQGRATHSPCLVSSHSGTSYLVRSFPRAFAACVLRHAGAAKPPLFRGLLQLTVFLKNFKFFFDHFLLSKIDENWHGYLFPTCLNFLISTSRLRRDLVTRFARPCLGLSAALSWSCHIVLYIYAENSTLGLKTVYRWQ